MMFLRRLALIPPLLLVISFAAFILVKQAPGSPFDKERRPASPDIERNLRAKYHLDEPLWHQYLRYLGLRWEKDATGHWRRISGGLIAGDFGPSMKYRSHTVNDLIAQGLPVSMALGLLAFCFAHGVGLPLGLYAASRREQWGDRAASLVALLCICIPAFVVGPILIVIVSIELRWLPPGLWTSPMHMILPTVALGLYFAGRVARLFREGLISLMGERFVLAARAKGLSEVQILWKHAGRLAILPVVSYAGPLLADLLTGSFVVENLFRIPGIGVFLVNGALSRDYFVVIGMTLIYALLLMVANLLVDCVYPILDPRIPRQ